MDFIGSIPCRRLVNQNPASQEPQVRKKQPLLLEVLLQGIPADTFAAAGTKLCVLFIQ